MNEISLNTSQTLEVGLKNLVKNEDILKKAILENPDAVKRLLDATLFDEMKADIAQQKLLMKYDYETEKADFMETLKSENTKNGYLRALSLLESFTKSLNLTSPMFLTFIQADEWIRTQAAENKSAATIKRNVAACSSFFSRVSKKSNFKIVNPFRKSDALKSVGHEPKRENHFYSFGVDNKVLKAMRKDVETIILSVDNPILKTIIHIMAYRGLRIGAFPGMTIEGDTFDTVSKGKRTKGKLDRESVEMLKREKLDAKKPFRNEDADRLKNLLKYHTKHLKSEGKIKFAYSAHDFRHFFALTEYMKDKDIHRVSKLLNHSSIAITEKYLRGLNADV